MYGENTKTIAIPIYKVLPYLVMSMLVPIVLVVGTKDCLQTNYGHVVHCCTKFHVWQLFISTWKTLIFI